MRATEENNTPTRHYCACCEALPKGREEARQMRHTGLCDECEGEARGKGWKPTDGLSDALSALNESGWSQEVKSKREKLQRIEI